jgi:hypothetical protein
MKNKTKFTKGPWMVQHRDNTFLKTIVTEDRENFKSIGDCTDENAALISAAPDMFEAIGRIVDECTDLNFEQLCLLKSVLRKARGES